MDMGRIIILAGVVLIIVGALFSLFGQSGFPKLPGDILIKRGNFTFYFPVVTSVLLSIILTVIIHLFFRK